MKLEGLALFIGVGSILVAVVAGKELLTLIYSPEYGEYQGLFIWLMVAAATSFMAYFLGYGMTAARYFRIQTLLHISAASTSVIVCLWLLPKIGLIGAAIGLLSGAIVQTIFSIGVIFHAVKKLDKK